jgi:hypothetical protein
VPLEGCEGGAGRRVPQPCRESPIARPTHPVARPRSGPFGWGRESQPFGDMGEEELPSEGLATASFSQRLVNGPLTS